MYLRSVQLINWRSYRDQKFEFPRPYNGKNVVLVMAPNECGKTSFFEAIALGLFGRFGLSLVPQARSAEGISYSKFLDRVLHKQAIRDGQPRCSVALKWEDEDKSPIEIKRTWHFSVSGRHKEDQLEIYEGRKRVPVESPPSDPDPERWHRGWIADHFVHSSLAEFFLFDGEQVQRYANHTMSDQVRDGIHGLLDFPVLHSLKDSLQSYAQYRRVKAAVPSDSTVRGLEVAIEQLENNIIKKKSECDDATECLSSLDDEMTELDEYLTRYGRNENTVASAKSLFDDADRYDKEARQVIDNLNDLIAGDMALAIAGIHIREKAIARLKAEAKREAWEAGRDVSSQNLDRFAVDLSERIDRLEPPIDANHREAVIEAAKAAWGALWYPPPDGCADGYLHTDLTGPKRALVIDHLEALGRHTTKETSHHLQQYYAKRTLMERKKQEALEQEYKGPKFAEQMQRLTNLSEQRGSLRQQQAAAEREIEADEAKIHAKRSELGRYTNKRESLDILYAKQAEVYADQIGELLKDYKPFMVDAVASEMTKVWKAMAHMSDRVERIEISSPGCEVKMLTADGEDLHQIDPSAGASQVFTQALITAITKVSGRTFPFIVDTPLARLSLEQRLGVLKTFTDRSDQVILLSTDQEVVDDKLDAIRDRIVASYELKVTHDMGIAVTSVHRLDLESV